MTADITTPANISAAPPSPTSSTRAARGRFAPGNPGGPGRPPKVAHIERELLACMATVLSPEIMMRVTQAMVLEALQGNVAAANWLHKTFLKGGLSQAAAAEAVGITAEAEMLVLGKAQHPEWARLWDERIAAELGRETALKSPASAAQTASAPSSQLVADPAIHQGAGREEPYRLAPAETVKTVETVKTAETVETETVETVETVKTVKTDAVTSGAHSGSAEIPAGAIPARACLPAESAERPPCLKTVDSAGVTVAPARPLTVPPAERVRGFRVTKGPRPTENGRKPSKPSAPSSTHCAAH